MSVILIADSCKPSLVMSSEVFKDKISGAVVHVATTGKQCLEILAQEKPDMCVVDFDLPDTDGVTLIQAMRKFYQGPILLTAYSDESVRQAVETDLFAFNDAGAWIPKPVKFEVLSDKIDQFLLTNHRVGRRFPVEMATTVIGRGAGRGKRAPKVSGRLVNVSLGGVCVALAEPMTLQGGDEMTVSLTLPMEAATGRRRAVAKSAKQTDAKGPEALPPAGEARIKCTVAWFDQKSMKAGLQFNRLTEVQRRGLEALLRRSMAQQGLSA